MLNKQNKSGSPVDALTSESARQRWELFHRAIAHAKQSANESLLEADERATADEPSAKSLSIVR
jgi:hypothetical protein